MTLGTVGVGIGIIYPPSGGGALRFTRGWTGLVNCGNLLTFKLDVAFNSGTLYGYRDPGDPVLPFGALDNNQISETTIYAAHVDTGANICQLRFGVNGFSKIQDLDAVTITWQGYPTITYLWDGANLDYRVTDAALAGYISRLDGQRISFDLDYIAIQATVDGTTALQRAILVNTESNEITVSMWARRDTGITVRKLYDIGDAIDGGNETTRLRIDNFAQIDSILSNTIDGGANWTNLAVINSSQVMSEDVMHHIYMTAKNDLVSGTGTQIMELWYDNVLIGTDTTFSGTPSDTFSFIAGDFVTLMARHNLAQFLQGRVADIWSSDKYMDAATHIPLFRTVTPANVDWAGGVPADIGISGIVNGVTPTTYLGGAGYSISSWNAGINRGSLGDFTRTGGIIS